MGKNTTVLWRSSRSSKFCPPLLVHVRFAIAFGRSSQFPIPDSRFPIPDSRFPIPYSKSPGSIPNS
ncbi:MAG: hypothetical protein F6K63_04375 [Moorea sp. SIO1G6]|uniref:hypothetical protein n=1 Tax=Moorena sp. SIO1G6 TaxID=2607840 RepID=UPI0013C01265|nr:hypothetical protein [Moorena sp. SIO1G6]NET63674.1 hypothetical protein [Moorena sp. SIO1G6]